MRASALVVVLLLILLILICGLLLAYQWAVSKPAEQQGELSFDFNIGEGDYRLLRNKTIELPNGSVRMIIAEFKSVEWGGSTWTHTMIYLEPQPPRSNLALLTAGGFGPNPNATFRYIVRFSLASGVPVAIITKVPNTPPGMDESLLLALSNVRALKTGDLRLSLLYPMAQAYIKAASLVEKLAPHPPSGFVISGGSKRGWTTWIVARHDPRVVALIPRSFNVADIALVKEAQLDAYGELRGGSKFFRSAAGEGNLTSLPGYHGFLQEYNPVSWINEVKDKPILVIMGTNDELFPPGLEATYIHLHPNIHVAYLPNASHTGVHGLEETWATIFSFIKHIEEERPWPEVGIDVERIGNVLAVNASAQGAPDSLMLVYAEPSRVGERYADYTGSVWRSINLGLENPSYILDLRGPLGVYILAVYRDGGLVLISTSQIATVS